MAILYDRKEEEISDKNKRIIRFVTGIIVETIRIQGLAITLRLPKLPWKLHKLIQKSQDRHKIRHQQNLQQRHILPHHHNKHVQLKQDKVLH